MTSQRTTILSAAVVTLGGFIFGLDAALISGGIGQISRQFGLSDLELGAVVSAPGFGVIFALLATGTICDRYGRKFALVVIASLYLVSAITSAFAPSFWTLVAARLLGGLAFTSLSVASIYIGEVAPAHLRGKLVSLNQLNIVIGLFAAYLINFLLIKLAASGAAWVTALSLDTQTWRWMLGMEILPALVWLGLLMKIDESPRWLLTVGREDAARAVLSKSMDLANIDALVDEAKTQSAAQSQAYSLKATVKMLLGTHLRAAFLVGILIAAVQPLTGINAILFYAPMVFEQAGIAGDAAFAQSVIVGATGIIFTLIALSLIDRLGRRLLIMIGLSGAGLCLLLCAWQFSSATYALTEAAAQSVAGGSAGIDLQAVSQLFGQTFQTDVAFKRALVEAMGFADARANEGALLAAAITIDPIIVLVGIIGFIAAYNFSIGPVMWVVISELFPTRVRGIGIAACALVVSIVNYLVQQAFPWQLANLGAANVFLFYASCALIGLGLLLWLLPETKNKSIEDIEDLFRRKADPAALGAS